MLFREALLTLCKSIGVECCPLYGAWPGFRWGLSTLHDSWANA